MKTILIKILLLIALTIFFGNAVYAEQNSSEKVSDTIATTFDFDNITPQQKSTTPEHTECAQTSAERMKIIEYQRENRIMLLEFEIDQRKVLAETNMKSVQIVAGLYAISLFVIIILMKITKHHAKDIVTILGLISVIFATLLLVLMITDTEQLIAPIGIFGAIAGYLFGTAPKKDTLEE